MLATQDQTIVQKLAQVNWFFLSLMTVLCIIGIASLYSAAGGEWRVWALPHLIRYILAFCLAVVVALIPIGFWIRMAYPIFFAGLGLLILVELLGVIGGGAQRWIDLGFMQLQPSELMKIGLVIALARYFHSRSDEEMKRPVFLVPPLVMIGVPVMLVLIQPDLGTAGMLLMGGVAMLFLGGAPFWLFAVAGGLGAASIPVIWHFLHDYQKQRILTFLNPERDPLGSGYHITQSKIALGSGGLDGKGFLEGSQSHLNFLPEKQTDFIFTLWAEEWGFTGALGLLALFGLILIYGFWISGRVYNAFGRYLVLGLTINFSLYLFVNVAMVTGLIPVVGAPLPLVSYGGTAMLAAMAGFGLIICAYVHRDQKIPRYL